MRLFLLICLLPCLALGQIQTVTFDNFAGGLNRTASSLANPSTAYDVVDFDFDPLGNLSPRLGMAVLTCNSDSIGGDTVQAVLPYSVRGDKYLIYKRCDAIDSCVYSFINPLLTADSVGFTDAWNPDQFDALPKTGLSYVSWGDFLYIAGPNTPMVVFDGARVFPVAPESLVSR